MLLHRFPVACGRRLIHEINPFLCRKVLHLSSPNSFHFSSCRSPAVIGISACHGIREATTVKNIGVRKLVKMLVFSELADENERSPEIGMRVFLTQRLHGRPEG